MNSEVWILAGGTYLYCLRHFSPDFLETLQMAGRSGVPQFYQPGGNAGSKPMSHLCILYIRVYLLISHPGVADNFFGKIAAVADLNLLVAAGNSADSVFRTEE